MSKLMRLNAVTCLVKLGTRIMNHEIELGSRRDVLHATIKIPRHRLGIFLVRILDARFLGKEFDHLRQTGSSDLTLFELIRINVGDDWNTSVLSDDRYVLAH